MTGTLEFRSTNQWGGYNETIFWRGKTPEQVRDEQYPGAQVTKVGPAPKRSIRASVDYCQLYHLMNPSAGILCSLAEIP